MESSASAADAPAEDGTRTVEKMVRGSVMHFDRQGRLHHPTSWAVESPCSNILEWWWHGVRHNANGAAVADDSVGRGTQEYWHMGERHRLDGPAVDYGENSDLNEYWLHGQWQSGARNCASDKSHLAVCWR